MQKPFTYILRTTDVGPFIELYEDARLALVIRDNATLGQGDELLDAWNDYLYGVGQAPVTVDALVAAWAAYDRWRGLPPSDGSVSSVESVPPVSPSNPNPQE